MAVTICETGADGYARYAEIDPSYRVGSALKVVPVAMAYTSTNESSFRYRFDRGRIDITPLPSTS